MVRKPRKTTNSEKCNNEKAIDRLAHRQKVFVVEYCRDHRGREAAVRAGYSEKSAAFTASHLLADPNVAAAVREREAEIAQAALLDDVAIVRGLLREANRFGPGSTHSARVNAWRELAKIRGLEVSKVEHTVTHKLDGRLAAARARARIVADPPKSLPECGGVGDEVVDVVPDGGVDMVDFAVDEGSDG